MSSKCEALEKIRREEEKREYTRKLLRDIRRGQAEYLRMREDNRIAAGFGARARRSNMEYTEREVRDAVHEYRKIYRDLKR